MKYISALILALSAPVLMGTLTNVPGGFYYPPISRTSQAVPTGAGTDLVLSAANHKVSFCGYFASSSSSVAVRYVYFRTLAVTMDAGSVFRVALENAATTPVPLHPDDTPDETVDVTGLAANTAYKTGALSADRTLAVGDLVCAVFYLSTFTASDSVALGAVGAADTYGLGQTVAAYYNGSTWAAKADIPYVVFENAAGTAYGTLAGAYVSSATPNSYTVRSSLNPNEYATQLQFPVPVKIDGFYVAAGLNASSGATLSLFDSDDVTTAVTNGVVTIAPGQVNYNGANKMIYASLAAPITLVKDHLYWLSWKPTADVNTTVGYFDVAVAAHFNLRGGGQAGARQGTGAFTVSGTYATRQLIMGVHVSAVDDGTATGGGGSSAWVQ